MAVILQEPLTVEKGVVEILEQQKIQTSRFIRKDVDELIIRKKACHPLLLASNLKDIQKRLVY